jgi:putative phosphoribosyl transferase
MMRFIEHSEAGRILAQRLLNLGIERPVVLAVPPGGPRVGKEIAARLDAPLDVLLIRSISIPGRGGCPVGVVVDGAFYPDEHACRREAVTLEYARILAWPEQGAEERWEREVRHNRHPIDIEGRTAIVVNDALLDREQLLAIRESLRERGVGRILHVAVLARGEEETGTLPVPTITLFSPVESRSVMLVNAGYQQTTEREIAELLTLTAGT